MSWLCHFFHLQIRLPTEQNCEDESWTCEVEIYSPNSEFNIPTKEEQKIETVDLTAR
jgi:hypothetical protein